MTQNQAAGGDALDDLTQRVESIDTRDYPLVALARSVLALLGEESALVEVRLAEALEHPDPLGPRRGDVDRGPDLAENRGDSGAHARRPRAGGGAVPPRWATTTRSP